MIIILVKKKLRAYEVGLLPPETKNDHNNNKNNNNNYKKKSAISTSTSFQFLIMKVRSQTVYWCISSEKFENCVDIKANLNL